MSYLRVKSIRQVPRRVQEQLSLRQALFAAEACAA